MDKSVAIVCGGGPAPGINTVVSTVAKVFLRDGYRVLGVHHGYKGLFADEPEIKEFDINPLFVFENGVSAGDVRIIV